jgi:hypothetical protein
LVAWGAAIVALAAGPGQAAAQNPACQGYGGQPEAFNLCNAAIDGTRAIQPVLGLLTSGGAPVLGTGNTLGGFGHAYLSARVNGTRLVLPDLRYDGASTTVGAGDKLFCPSPVIETAVGLFPGTSNGLLSIDFLGSAQLLPTNQIDNLSITSTARHIGSLALGLGVGARVGLVNESDRMPGIGLSFMYRDVPELRYGDLGAGANVSVAANVHAVNLRAMASKRFGIAGLGGGLGWDHYSGGAQVQFRNPATAIPEPAIDLDLSTSRVMGFVNAGVGFTNLKLTGEAGYQLGKDEHFVTTFEDFDPAGGRFFASVALAVGL